MEPSMYMSIGIENDCDFKEPLPNTFLMSLSKGKGSITPLNFVNHDNNVSEDDEDGTSEKKGKKESPWQRMKWTDNIVRLLIAVVACVGDEDEGLKRKAGALQKKGKWKTVSKIMISKGCHVSPQQCEDKFNDLNKRYKKLNDILGRGTSCRVVEDPSVLDSMINVSPKMKDDVKKILSSKHLFYQEMCAYHNGQQIPNCEDFDLPFNPLPEGKCSKENSVFEEGGEEQGEEIFVSEDDESDYEDQKGKQNEEGYVLVGFQAEVAEAYEIPMKSKWEQKQSIKKQLLHLQEQRVSIKAQGFEIEQRWFKWQRFCRKKETELERLRLDNERMRLVNEGMLLQLKHKKIEIGSKKMNASSETGPLSIEKMQGLNHIDLSSPL